MNYNILPSHLLYFIIPGEGFIIPVIVVVRKQIVEVATG